MKKIIESELISIAHRILKLKDKADIDALYNEAKNVFEKISVLKFYENNKFRIDTNITDEIIEKALFSEINTNEITSYQNNESLKQTDFLVDENQSKQINDMNLDLINELIEESENSEIKSFGNEVLDEVSELEKQTVEDFIEDLNIDLTTDDPVFNDVDLTNVEQVVLHEQVTFSVTQTEEQENEKETNVIEIDPVYNLQLEEIEFEQITEVSISEIVSEHEKGEVEKQNNFENQHLMNSSDGYEMPFHQVPLSKTINDAFSHMITIGLNDRIAFEKNLFDGSSEDLNRVLSQLNTIETYQEAQDFIDDLVKPDFNFWKGKEEYEERFMHLIQKRFL